MKTHQTTTAATPALPAEASMLPQASPPPPVAPTAAPAIADTDLPQLTTEYMYAQTYTFEKLSDTKKIGDGGQAKVHSGLYKGKPVAVKEFRQAKDFKDELTPMTCFRSPYTEPVLGIDREHHALLMPLKKGSLKDLYRNSPITEFPWAILLNITLALSHIHACGYAHRDIKSANILIDHNGFATLTDYGLAWCLANKDFHLHMGTLPYMAPELFGSDKKIDLIKTDIYSLGILILELVIGYENYKKLYASSDQRELITKIKNGDLYSKITQEVIKLNIKMPAVCELISACINNDPSKRPSTEEILDAIKKQGIKIPVNTDLRPLAPPPKENLFYWVDKKLRAMLQHDKATTIQERHVTRLAYLYAITDCEQDKKNFVAWLATQPVNPSVHKLVYFLKKTTTNDEDKATLARISPDNTIQYTLENNPANTDTTHLSDIEFIRNACKYYVEGLSGHSTFFYRGYVKCNIKKAIPIEDSCKAEKVASIIDEYAFGLGV